MARCPVCRRTIHPTRLAHIAAHLDTVERELCPASGHPYFITLPNT